MAQGNILKDNQQKYHSPDDVHIHHEKTGWRELTCNFATRNKWYKYQKFGSVKMEKVGNELVISVDAEGVHEVIRVPIIPAKEE